MSAPCDEAYNKQKRGHIVVPVSNMTLLTPGRRRLMGRGCSFESGRAAAPFSIIYAQYFQALLVLTVLAVLVVMPAGGPGASWLSYSVLCLFG